jgi:hypothetical protein
MQVFRPKEISAPQVTARNESHLVLGQPGQHALVQRRLRLLHETNAVGMARASVVRVVLMRLPSRS